MSAQTEDGKLHKRELAYAKVFGGLIHDLGISDGAVRLYAHMHWRYGQNHQMFESGISMGNVLGVSDRAIRKRAVELSAAGWIVIIARKKEDGSKTSNFYHVFEHPQDADAFRKEYIAGDGEFVLPKASKQPRKSRKGKGGAKAHKPKEATGTQVPLDESSLSTGTQVPPPTGTQVPPIQNQFNQTQLKDSLDASLSSDSRLNEPTMNSTSERDDEVSVEVVKPVEIKVVPQRKPGSFGALHPELSDEELDALAARLEAEEAAKKQRLLDQNTANAKAEEELYVAVREVFGAGGGEIGEAGNYVRMLRGKMKVGRKKKKQAPDTWDEMSTLFKDNPVDAAELHEWAEAWKQANKDASMVKNPITVASSIDARRQLGKIIGSTKSATDGFRPIDTSMPQVDRRLLL